MSKNIAIADDVYEVLEREKGDRSFSEVIRDKLDEGGRIEDVAGAGVLDAETHEAVEADIERLSRGTTARLDDETP